MINLIKSLTVLVIITLISTASYATSRIPPGDSRLHITINDGEGFSLNSRQRYSSQYSDSYQDDVNAAYLRNIARNIKILADTYRANPGLFPGTEGVLSQEKLDSAVDQLGRWYANVKYSKEVIQNTPWVREDDEIRNAWSQGYDGTGVTIDIYDGFDSTVTARIIVEDGSFDPDTGYSQGSVGFRITEGILYDPASHGKHVAAIAGGKTDFGVIRGRHVFCRFDHSPGQPTIQRCPSNSEIEAKHGPTIRTSDTINVVGIAPEATVNQRSANTFVNGLRGGASIDLTDTDIANLSFAVYANIGVSSTHANSFTDSTDGTLFVKAAGNTGRSITQSGRLTSIDHVNNALLGSRYETSTLLVGALGRDGTIADYSSTPSAGSHQNNFVVDYGHTFAGTDPFDGEDNRLVGTSFAAPRVAGKAAIVKSKFSNMTGAQLADVIKRTADDLGAPGVDSIYGHGQVNLGRALSPIGNVR